MSTSAVQVSYSKKTHRQLSIKTLFSYLKPYEYVLLKHTDKQLSDLSIESDLDILLSENEVSTLINQLKVDSNILKCESIAENAMTQVFIYFKDRSFLQVDFLHDFRRKALVYLDQEEIRNGRIQNEEGIWVCNTFHLLEHVVLFNFLNGAGVPAKYLLYLKQRESSLLQSFNQKYHTTISDLSAFAKYQSTIHQSLLNVVSLLPQNKGWNKVWNKKEYYQKTFSKFNSNRGMIITFSGVDGAGKSTILENVKTLLKKKYRREVVVLRHRPSVLPILSAYKHGKAAAEKRAASTLPRQGGNNNRISSLFRFCYYFFDYLFGQHYVHVKHIMRGRVLLYDRYYYDFIVDGRRSNIDLGKELPSYLYRWVKKPDLNFFLFASPEVIRKRKQELDEEAIIQLTADYKQLFQKLSQDYASKNYQCIENIDLKDTMQHIEAQYIQHL